MSRRRFLSRASAAAAAFAAAHLVPLDARASALYQEDLWGTASEILRRIKAPVFPARDMLITAHGAKGDGAFDSGPAFRAAIEACHAAAGGRVVMPPGRYLTGALRLRSNVNLHVQEGSTDAFLLRGFAESPITDIRVTDCRFDGVAAPDVIEGVRDLVLTNVTINGEKRNERISR